MATLIHADISANQRIDQRSSAIFFEGLSLEGEQLSLLPRVRLKASFLVRKFSQEF